MISIFLSQSSTKKLIFYKLLFSYRLMVTIEDYQGNKIMVVQDKITPLRAKILRVQIYDSALIIVYRCNTYKKTFYSFLLLDSYASLML